MNNPEQKIISSADIGLEKNRKLFRKYLGFFIVVLLVVISFFIGYKKGENSLAKNNISIPINEAFVENKYFSDDKKIDFSLFWKVWDLLKEKHVDKNNLDAQKMIYGAINGMLRATGDPYSYFFDPEQSKSFAEDIEGIFEGIGAELGIKDDLLTIIAPLDGSPAQKAGLRSGDKILKIDDKIAADMTIDQAVDIIRGKKGTQVKLTILHENEQETKEVVITREKIEIKNIEIDFKENNIAYIKITRFSDNTDAEFNDAINEIVSKKSQGIILDLRDNPGGLLEKSIIIASRMIPKGKVVVLEEDSAGEKKNIYTSGGDKLSSLPTVVIINEGSASASEILAGALRDNQEITLIGEKTFGKGSVQQLISLSGGSSVKITVAKWLTPKGNYIMDKGIAPDIEVEMTREDYENERDPQLDKALEVIKEKIHPVK